MPVILLASEYERWLDPANQNVGSLQDLLRPYPADLMKAVPVSTYVNDTKHTGERCSEALA
jgi:putative SOS response-associated peptidase YedK